MHCNTVGLFPPLKLLIKLTHTHLRPHVNTTCLSPAHTLLYFEVQLSPYRVIVF